MIPYYMMLILPKSNLTMADLINVNAEKCIFDGATLRSANLTGSCLNRASLKGVNLTWARLINCSLCEADLLLANIEYADLTGSNLNLASWPLWWGSFNVNADSNLADQLAYQFLK